MLPHLSIDALFRQIGTAGDTAAYKELFLRYYDRLVSFASHITRNRFTAEEVVSDVFLKLWNNRASLPDVREPNLYLYMAIRNTALNALKKEQRHAHLPEIFGNGLQACTDTDPEQLLYARDAGGQLQQLLEQLPAQCRLIFRLVKEEGLRYKEVAALLGLSPKTVESQMTIALRRLNQMLHVGGSPVHFN